MKLISQVLAIAAVATLVVPALAQTSSMMHKPMMKKPTTAKKMAMKNRKMIMNNRMMIKKHTKMMKKGMMMKKPMMHSTMKPMMKKSTM